MMLKRTEHRAVIIALALVIVSACIAVMINPSTSAWAVFLALGAYVIAMPICIHREKNIV